MANAKPDGYNLLAMHTGIVCSYLTGGTEVNPLEDLDIVAVMEDFGVQAIIASPDAPYNDFAEMVEYAKAHPGELSCAIQTNGSTEFLWGMISQETGAEFKMVEAANETEKLTNVAGGFISLGNCSATNGAAYEKDGKVKVLALLPSSDKSDTSGYDYKTIKEQGFDITFPNNMLIFAPKGTPEADLKAINASLEGVLKDNAYQEGMKSMGSTADWKNLDDSRAALQEAFDTYKMTGEALGIVKAQ